MSELNIEQILGSNEIKTFKPEIFRLSFHNWSSCVYNCHDHALIHTKNTCNLKANLWDLLRHGVRYIITLIGDDAEAQRGPTGGSRFGKISFRRSVAGSEVHTKGPFKRFQHLHSESFDSTCETQEFLEAMTESKGRFPLLRKFYVRTDVNYVRK